MKLCAIEVKSAVQPNKKHLTGLKALAEEFPRIKKYLICQCTSPMEIEEGVQALPFDVFLNKLWRGEII
jgi:alpha-glucuronidase